MLRFLAVTRLARNTKLNFEIGSKTEWLQAANRILLPSVEYGYRFVVVSCSEQMREIFIGVPISCKTISARNRNLVPIKQ